MLTPQRTLWSGWKTRKEGTGSGSGSDKGKGLAEPSTPVGPNGGLVDPAVVTLDRDGLVAKVSKLESELYDYQYNMGILLIEKKEWTLKLEELWQELEDAKNTLKREQASHQIAIDEVEKREENLRKALGVEKQCVLDLEKTLREMRSEYADIKFTADSKLAEATALVASVEDRSLELEAKLRAVDAKLAEVSRRNSDIERKAQDLEAREHALRRDRSSFLQEREAHDNAFAEQRKDLREWEMKLQEGEERLAVGQRILNQREERMNDNDKIIMQKEKDLGELQKRIDSTHSSLKVKEDEIHNRIANLASKEKEYDELRESLDMKEKNLLALEEKLNEREKTEIQKLTNEHNDLLDAKRREFDMEFDQKRKSLEEELKSRFIEVERKEAEINHVEEKFAKREKTLENKLEKLKEREKSHEAKIQALKEKEKSIKAEEKHLATEQEKMLLNKEDLLSLKAEVEKIRGDNEQKILNIREEEAQLKITEEERLEYIRLQSELKQAMDDCRKQKEQILKEAEDMKQQKEHFEREWEELDVKRTEVEKMLKDLDVQKEKFEKMKLTQEERLRNEKVEMENYMQKELDDLKLAKESFEATMKHEKLVVSEKAQSEKRRMIDDLEQQRREMETGLQHKQEEMEKQLREKEKLFEDKRDKELNNLNFERDMARREMDEMKLERRKIDNERKEVAENKERLVAQQNEMRKDIEELFGLSNKLKEQREHFIKERESFVSFVERHKSCKNCGEITYELLLSDLHSLYELEKSEFVSVPRLAGEYLKDAVQENSAAADQQSKDILSGSAGVGSPTSGGMSWLRKCTSKIFKFSPAKRFEGVANQTVIEEADVPDNQVHMDESNEQSKSLDGTRDELELSNAVCVDSHDIERVQSDSTTIREVESRGPSVEDQSNINSQAEEDQRDSGPFPVEGGGRKLRSKGQAPSRARIHRTRSVKAVVKEAKVILGNSSKGDESVQANGDAEDSGQMNTDSRGNSGVAAEMPQRKLRKRNRSHMSHNTEETKDNDDIEVQSKADKRSKRRQKVAASVQPPHATRYNLRRPKRGVVVAHDDASVEVNEVGEGQNEETNPNKNAPEMEAGITNGNGRHTHVVQAGMVGDSYDVDCGSKEVAENVERSEEVDGTPKGTGKYGAKEHQNESDAEEDEEDEELEHPGEASIGKKLWNFLTT